MKVGGGVGLVVVNGIGAEIGRYNGRKLSSDIGGGLDRYFVSGINIYDGNVVGSGDGE